MSAHLADISLVKDEAVYGVFPAFKELIRHDELAASLLFLRQLDRASVSGIMGELPQEWDVQAAVRSAWTDFLCHRAQFLADTLMDRVRSIGWPGCLFDHG